VNLDFIGDSILVNVYNPSNLVMSKVHVPTVKTGSHARAKEYFKDSGEFKSIKADFMCRNDSYTTGYQEH
jgi:hypothetical protein